MITNLQGCLSSEIKSATLAEITSEEEYSFIINSVGGKLKHPMLYFLVMLKILLICLNLTFFFYKRLYI